MSGATLTHPREDVSHPREDVSRRAGKPSPRSALHEASWRALGTNVVLRVTEREHLAGARAAVEAELDAIDLACSRFREDSELVRVNNANGRVTPVGALLGEALALALWAAQLTGGRLDPTIGRTLELAGYDRDHSLLQPARAQAGSASGACPDTPSTLMRPVARRRPPSVRACFLAGWEAVDLDLERATVRVPAGVHLDLGATAKAWAADRACEAAQRATGTGVLVGLGGDIATAGPPPPDGWRIHVTDDHAAPPDAPGQTISIGGGGLASSSTTVRRWHCRGEDMHHLIDPRTRRPLRGPWRTAGVAASCCAHANIAATAALLHGADAERWIVHVGLPARLVDQQGRARALCGWPTATDGGVGR